eukprot:COSAG06_NODE_13572_length_1244_cov_1.045415_1_plen_148_part_00
MGPGARVLRYAENKHLFWCRVYVEKRSLYQDRLRTDTSTEPREERVLCRDRPSPDGDLGADNASLVAPFYTKKHDQLAKTGSGQTSKKLQKRDACVSRRPRGSGVGRTHFTLRCWTLTRIVSGQTRHFLHHLYIKTIILPRQARDKQ